jgi:hypothetical protein
VSQVRRAIITLAVAAAACAFGVPAATAGQIVWVQAAGNGAETLWAANDDGTYPHRLLAASASELVPQFPGATLSEPDLFQIGGATVLFTASTYTFAAPANPAACGQPCAATFSLTAGVLTRQAPAVSTPPPTASVFELQPRLTADGEMVDHYAVYPSATPASLGAVTQHGLYTRPLNAPSPGTVGTAWADTATETLPQDADPAPDPANPALLAWVENQDPSCTHFRVRSKAVCQYAIHVAGGAATSAPPVAIFDDETPFGTGPSSLAWSSDGSKLLVVDDQAPNDGIYTFPSSTAIAPGSKKITELIAEPPGWTFGQARFAGTKVIFDAAGNGHSRTGTSDIYSISAGCDSGTCAFPANATNLTAKASNDNVDPAWTSAVAPLVPLDHPIVAGAPPVLDAARILSRKVSAKKGVSFEVTLSAAAAVIVSISRNGHTIGTTTLHLPVGASTFTIKQSGGHALTRGSDTGKLRIQGAASNAVSFSASFSVS